MLELDPEMVATLYTIHEEPFTVDDEDASLVTRFSWRMANHALPHLKPKLVLVARVGPDGRTNRDLFLRHFIMGAPPTPDVVAFSLHENPWCLEKSNLVWLDRATIRHWTSRSESLSGYRGVMQRSESAPWRMRLGCNRDALCENFNTAKEAAQAYDQAARDRFGSWARVNFPKPDDPVRKGLSFAPPIGPLIATDGAVIQVDSQFLTLLHRHPWQPGKDGYWTTIGMTHLPLAYLLLGRPGAGGHPKIDWIDGDVCNCTLSNLRWRHLGESPFLGVTRTRNHWAAKLGFKGGTRHLGVYKTSEEAARAYDVAARELLGPKARMNFPEVFGSKGL